MTRDQVTAGPVRDRVTEARPWTGRTRGGLAGNWIFVQILRWFGLRSTYVVLPFVALYFVLAAPGARKASRKYRRQIGYGRTGWLGDLWNCYKHFSTFGKLLLDRVAMVTGPAERFRIEFDGEDHLRSALEEGRGLVLISAHFGNWQGAGHLLGRLGRPVNVVAYEGEARRIQSLFGKVLEKQAFSVISSDGSANSSVAILAALRRGEVVAMHADRCLGSDGAVVEFLGAPARFPVGPYVVAALSQAPLAHVFAMRQSLHHYRFMAYPPERLAFGDRRERKEKLAQWARRFVSRLEDTLRQFPLQWCNFYDFWSLGDCSTNPSR